MNKEMQKDIFLNSEGDAWFERNKRYFSNVDSEKRDVVLKEITELPINPEEKTSILEIGCGSGDRISWLQDNFNWTCYGIDPSKKAVEYARKSGVDVKVGAADKLIYDNNKFDIVIFGFCLYLCDREDLAKIAKEADRVLKKQGWVVIYDFYSPQDEKHVYHHKEGIYSYKTDYRNLFSHQSDYICMTHKIRHHNTHSYTDDRHEWESVIVLRKFAEEQ